MKEINKHKLSVIRLFKMAYSHSYSQATLDGFIMSYNIIYRTNIQATDIEKLMALQ